MFHVVKHIRAIILRLLAVSVIFIVFLLQCAQPISGSLSDKSGEPPYPWTFDNDLFGGPDFWGLVNTEWRMCRVGQLQSPINIDPALLLFDPHLSPLSIARHPVEASFRNTGQLPVVTINAEANHSNSQAQSTSSPPYQPPKEPILQSVVNISGGPAFPYNYQLHQVVFHFGLSRSTHGEVPIGGSEHTVDRIRFPAEVQLFAFNSDLYDNFSVAVERPRGILAISVIVDIGEASNIELRRMTVASQTITYKERETRLKKFHPANLLPKTDHYVTYEGSLTFPGCHETVTWIVMNKPIYITLEDLAVWNKLQQLDEKHAASIGATNNPLYMAQNYRPVKPTNGRLLRTNINVKYKSRTSSTTSCPSNIYLDMGYRFNLRRGSPPQNVTTRKATRQQNRRHTLWTDEEFERNSPQREENPFEWDTLTL